MSSSVRPSPVGYEVLGFELIGKELDGRQRWVGADVWLHIPPLGRFFLNVVTKERFLDEGFEKFFDDQERPEAIFEGDTNMERRLSFVVNHEVLTLSALNKAFLGVTV